MDANVELQAACAALGYLDGDNYHKEPDCLGNHSHGFLSHDTSAALMHSAGFFLYITSQWWLKMS